MQSGGLGHSQLIVLRRAGAGESEEHREITWERIAAE
jgi:hypothetical protein